MEIIVYMMYTRDMAESLKSKRVIFPKGKQSLFIENAKNRLGITHNEFAKKLGIVSRSLSDWKREKLSMSQTAVQWINENVGIPIPKGVEIKDPFWYVHKGASKGGKARFREYGSIGDPEIRMKKWRLWWQEVGQFKESKILFKRKKIIVPSLSKQLAEFVGIVMGDGGISSYQVTITLHSIDDKEYSHYVSKLIYSLFKISPGLYKSKRCRSVAITISRKELVDLLTIKLGLVKGDKIKQQIDIPAWVKQKKEYRIACLRGLVDTDGSVFTHRYKVGNKCYEYKKLSFTSASKPLRRTVYSILEGIGFYPRYARNMDVRLDRTEDIKNYFKIVDSHNAKHLRRYAK